MSRQWEDSEFMASSDAVRHRGPRLLAHSLLIIIVTFFAVALIWANWATLDEVTNGEGKVIPSSQLQVVQNLEGGIVSEILVKEGDTVEKDQVLLRIDDTRFSSSYREAHLRHLTLLAKIHRLTLEAEGQPYTAHPKVEEENPAINRNERGLYQSRQTELKSVIAIFQEQLEQRKQEIIEIKALSSKLKTSYQLAKKELDITAPLVKKGIMSEVELLRLKREVNSLESELESNRLALPRAKSALTEAQRKIEEQTTRFQREAYDELNELKDEFLSLQETIRAQEDRVIRTTVRSPVKGTVQRLLVNTIGGVVQPGMDLVEIVPLEDTLLIEAKIRPQDIAFLHPDQKAIIKLSAYDFSIYGGLDATVEFISADTIYDERGDAFYQIRLRTQETELERAGETHPIIPGMTATVDIMTGKKTVLDYLLKPIKKAQQKAMRER